MSLLDVAGVFEVEPLVFRKLGVIRRTVEHRDDRSKHRQRDDEQQHVSVSTHESALALSILVTRPQWERVGDENKSRSSIQYSNGTAVEYRDESRVE